MAVGMRLRAHAVHEFANPGVPLEIARDVVLCFAATDVELTGETECTHAVHEAEIDRLGRPPLVRIDLFQRHAEHLGGGRPMDVLVAVEGRQQAGVAGQVGHDAQFDSANSRPQAPSIRAER